MLGRDDTAADVAPVLRQRAVGRVDDEVDHPLVRPLQEVDAVQPRGAAAAERPAGREGPRGAAQQEVQVDRQVRRRVEAVGDVDHRRAAQEGVAASEAQGVGPGEDPVAELAGDLDASRHRPTLLRAG